MNTRFIKPSFLLFLLFVLILIFWFYAIYNIPSACKKDQGNEEYSVLIGGYCWASFLRVRYNFEISGDDIDYNVPVHSVGIEVFFEERKVSTIPMGIKVKVIGLDTKVSVVNESIFDSLFLVRSIPLTGYKFNIEKLFYVNIKNYNYVGDEIIGNFRFSHYVDAYNIFHYYLPQKKYEKGFYLACAHACSIRATVKTGESYEMTFPKVHIGSYRSFMKLAEKIIFDLKG